MAYQLKIGKIPTGLHVLHHCDNPPCCNPKHLFVGTDKDNIEDMIRKGRNNTPKGESHRDAKLTEKQVLEIRKRHVPFVLTYSMLAREYGVSKSTIQHAVNGSHWKHI
jgi:hypothetical protein